MSIIENRRIGRFRISFCMINRDPDACRAVFSNVIVLDTAVNLHSDDIEYVAICDSFAQIEVGEEMPLYRPSLRSHYDEFGNVKSVELVDWHGDYV